METSEPLNRLTRLTAILTALQSKKIITANELAKKFQISKRTIYRDMKALEESGVPIHVVDGIGYSLVDGYNLPPVMFTEEEANALITADQFIAKNRDASLVEQHASAITKIKAVLKHSSKEKVALLSERIAYFKNFRNTRSSNFISTVQLAITNASVLKIKYQAISKNIESERELEPYGLYHTQDNWILIAWCLLRNDFREFRLDRISTMEVLKNRFEDRGFILMEYFMNKIKALEDKKSSK